MITLPKPLTTWIPDELAEKFDYYCDQEGHCRSDMIRKIVLGWLDNKMKNGNIIKSKIHIEESKVANCEECNMKLRRNENGWDECPNCGEEYLPED